MQAESIKDLIDMYNRELLVHDQELPDHLIQECVQNISDNFKTSKERANDGEFTIRMSNLGRPLCQNQYEQKGEIKHPRRESTLSSIFATGSMLEHYLVMLIKGAGVPVEALDIPCSLDIYDRTIKGSADIIIDGVVYDIKSSSKYAFQNKWSKGFGAVYEDDPFGYVTQGYCYAKALGVPFGGWIVICKDDSEIAVCETSGDQEALMAEAFEKATYSVRALVESHEVEKQFDDVPEIFYKKPTGHRKLCMTCDWCDYKESCWENLQVIPSIPSTAANPPVVSYTYIDEEKRKQNEKSN
jgi:hypothetical protein